MDDDELTTDGLKQVRVWDLPTRVFHWALALCVISSIVSGLSGGNALVWHFRLGYAVFALLAFRLLWGMVGGHWSRFANFIYAPTTVVRYLQEVGIPPERMIASGRAEYQPIAENDTPDGRKKNRRIEITLVDRNAAQEAAPAR